MNSLMYAALYALGLAWIIGTWLAAPRIGRSEYAYWCRVLPACVVCAVGSTGGSLGWSQVPALAMMAALIGYGVRRAWRARPLPPWYGGAHERIDNP